MSSESSGVLLLSSVAWLAGDLSVARALRYEVLRHCGDAPAALAAYLLAAGGLADSPAQIERWLERLRKLTMMLEDPTAAEPCQTLLWP